MSFLKKLLRTRFNHHVVSDFRSIYHSISLVGDRDENQDYSIQKSSAGCHVMVLADGMGGHSGGQLASEYFSEDLIQNIEKDIELILKDPNESITKLVSESRQKMLSKISAIDKSLNPNTTFVTAIVGRDKLVIAHLGDSRCLIVNENEILAITKDHSMAQLYADQGIIKSEEISNHPGQSKLLKAIGRNVDDDPEVKIINLTSVVFPIYIFQMTDGFWQGISKNELREEIKIFENNLDKFGEILDNLADKAVRRTSPDADNTTIQVCRITK